jgi:membrane peptidoglycan carboxypeptidase
MSRPRTVSSAPGIHVMISRLFAPILPSMHPLKALARLARVVLGAAAAFHAALFVIMLVSCTVLARCNPPVTSLMAYRAATAHEQALPVRFVPLRAIPRSVQNMFIWLEDKKFYTHIGIDPGAIRDAYRVNKAIGYVLYGGSTITQQLARTLFLTPRKTYFRKYVEALIAMEMDLLLSKERILELYLNYIELGRNVYGIGAAASAFFSHPAERLSVDEFRRLVAILPNPLRYTVDTYFQSRQMAERYRYLVRNFPDPADAPVVDSEGDPTAARQRAADSPPTSASSSTESDGGLPPI